MSSIYVLFALFQWVCLSLVGEISRISKDSILLIQIIILVSRSITESFLLFASFLFFSIRVKSRSSLLTPVMSSSSKTTISRCRAVTPFSNHCTLCSPPSSQSCANQRNFSAPPPIASGTTPSGSRRTAFSKNLVAAAASPNQIQRTSAQNTSTHYHAAVVDKDGQAKS